MREAEEELKKYENRERYLLNKIENIRSLVLPKGISIEPDKIPSTKRVDKNLEYVSQLEDVEKELAYVRKEIKNLMKYIEQELISRQLERVQFFRGIRIYPEDEQRITCKEN